MKNVLVNNEGSVTCPDGFYVMGTDELAQLFTAHDPDRFGIRDKERHVIVTMEWKQYKPLALKMTNIKSIADRNEKLTGRVYKGNDYQLENFFTGQADSRAAEGYCFIYRVQDIVQTAQSALFMNGTCVYRLTCVGREENREMNQEIFREIMDALRFV